MAQIMFSAGAGRFDQLRTAVEDAGITVPASIRSKQGLLEWLDTEGHTYQFENQITTSVTGKESLVVNNRAIKAVQVGDPKPIAQKELNLALQVKGVQTVKPNNFTEAFRITGINPLGEQTYVNMDFAVALIYMVQRGIAGAAELRDEYYADRQGTINDVKAFVQANAGAFQVDSFIRATGQQHIEGVTSYKQAIPGVGTAAEATAKYDLGSPLYLKLEASEIASRVDRREVGDMAVFVLAYHTTSTLQVFSLEPLDATAWAAEVRKAGYELKREERLADATVDMEIADLKLKSTTAIATAQAEGETFGKARGSMKAMAELLQMKRDWVNEGLIDEDTSIADVIAMQAQFLAAFNGSGVSHTSKLVS